LTGGDPRAPLTPWIDVFVDVPPGSAAAFRAFWSAVTGWPESSPRGDRSQFRSLFPPRGRAYLRVQELDGPPRVHLDLICPGGEPALDAQSERLQELGASAVDVLDGVRILTSPAGQVFCLVHDDEPRPALGLGERAHTWPGGHRSRLTQVCLDVPPAAYDAELAFWADATGWTPSPTPYPDFTYLLPPAEVAETGPLHLLPQRLADPNDVLGAHLDLGCTDVPAEVARLLSLGAIDRGGLESWHVLADPVIGLPFCVTVAPP
jgi:hypothetical protein